MTASYMHTRTCTRPADWLTGFHSICVHLTLISTWTLPGEDESNRCFPRDLTIVSCVKTKNLKKQTWCQLNVDGSCVMSHFTVQGNDLNGARGRKAPCSGCRRRTCLPLSPHLCGFSTMLLIWCFALRNSAAPPIPSKLSTLSLSPSLSLSPPPSLTRPDINDTAIWGSSSSPALSLPPAGCAYTHTHTHIHTHTLLNQ